MHFMPVDHRNYGNARAVFPKGRLDHENCESFRTELATHLDDAVRAGEPLVLDLSGLEYVSSAGLRCLMLAAKEADARQGRVMVAAMQPVVAEIFQISRFHMVFEVFSTLREALASVSPQAAEAFDRA
jgi:anti-sigma B factor antagonist